MTRVAPSVLVLAFLLLTACGGAGDERAAGAPPAIDRAEAAVDEELAATARALGVAAPATPERSGRAPCREEDPARRHVTGGARLSFRLDADPETLLDAAARRWRAAGHRVRIRRGAFPAVLATAPDGATLSLQLLPEQERAVLAGGTPCLPA